MISRILAWLDAAACERSGSWNTATMIRYFDYVGRIAPKIIAAQTPSRPKNNDDEVRPET